MVKEESMDAISKTMHMITNMNDRAASIIIGCFIIILIILILIYYFYMKNLLNKECLMMDNMYSKINGSIKSLNSADPNCQYNLQDYYISTAYNCCSGGAYKNDFVGTCNLKNILRQGVRGLDFEIYSVNNQPVVATSTVDSNYVKETYNSVPFADAMSIIINYAFSNSNAPNPHDPILLHLRIKSGNQAMYQNLADLFKSYDSYFLGPEYSYENNGLNLGTVPLLKLNGKIIVIVDRINTSFMDNQDFYEYVNITSNSMFMRALNYYNVKNTQDINELQNYNKRNMTIALPDKGPNPENPSGIVTRETGAQMSAMRFQQFDTNMEENMLFFNQSGYAFVLKPERLRYVPITIPEPTPQNPALSYATRTVATDYYSFNV